MARQRSRRRSVVVCVVIVLARGGVEEAASFEVVHPLEVSGAGALDVVEEQALHPRVLPAQAPADLEALLIERELVDVFAAGVAPGVGARLHRHRAAGLAALLAPLGLFAGLEDAEGDEVLARALLELVLAEEGAGALGLLHAALVVEEELGAVLALVGGDG